MTTIRALGSTSSIRSRTAVRYRYTGVASPRRRWRRPGVDCSEYQSTPRSQCTSKKCSSLVPGMWICGCLRSIRYRLVIPAFWAPTTTKSGSGTTAGRYQSARGGCQQARPGRGSAVAGAVPLAPAVAVEHDGVVRADHDLAAVVVQRRDG